MFRGYMQHNCCRLQNTALAPLCRRLSGQKRSPYQVLGVPNTATKAEIKKSYIDKAKKCHPDLFPDNDQKKAEFQELQEAYEILSDAKKRGQLNQKPQPGQSPFHQPSPRQQYYRYTPGFGRHPYPGSQPPSGNPGGNYHRFRQGGPDPWAEFLKMHAERERMNPEATEDMRQRGRRHENAWMKIIFIYFAVIIIYNVFLRPQRKTEIFIDQEQMEKRMRGHGPPGPPPMSQNQLEIMELLESMKEENEKKKK